MGMGQRDAGLADINAGYALLPGDQRALGERCVQQVYSVLECMSPADSQCSSQDAIDEDMTDVCSMLAPTKPMLDV